MAGRRELHRRQRAGRGPIGSRAPLSVPSQLEPGPAEGGRTLGMTYHRQPEAPKNAASVPRTPPECCRRQQGKQGGVAWGAMARGIALQAVSAPPRSMGAVV